MPACQPRLQCGEVLLVISWVIFSKRKNEIKEREQEGEGAPGIYLAGIFFLEGEKDGEKGLYI